MYYQRFSLFAVQGKGAELRAVLEQRTRERQAQGVRTALSTLAFGIEPCQVLTFAFDDLGALEAFRASELGKADPRTAPLLRAGRLELYESLLQIPPASTPVRFTQRVTLTPLPGKAREMQQLVLDLSKARQAEGIRSGVSVQAAGPVSGSLVVTNAFGSLLEFEKLRARNQADSAFQEFGRRLAAIAAHSAVVELFEVIIPFQPRE